MKKHALLVASLCLVVGLAPAYAQVVGVRVKVPFNFAFAGKSFPAGDYTMVIDSRQVSLEDAQGTTTVALAYSAGDGSASPKGRVIFQCYGEHCFLSEVWQPGRNSGAKLIASKAEVEMAKKETKTYLAVLGDGPKN